eukprot:4819494-Alexandrium_andersonii.AAC.1
MAKKNDSVVSKKLLLHTKQCNEHPRIHRKKPTDHWHVVGEDGGPKGPNPERPHRPVPRKLQEGIGGRSPRSSWRYCSRRCPQRS